ncbi:MAG: methyl-accepting chemotaxis protein [Thermodesulfobacteriota bacterium]
MKLGTKITSGFSLVLLIAVLLSGFSVFIMRNLTQEAQVLSEQYMPQTRIANDLDRHLQNMLSEMQGYDFSYEDSYLAKARQDLARVKKVLQEADAFGARYEGLGSLKENAALAAARIREYEATARSTEKVVKELQAVRKKLQAAAQEFTTPCNDFFDEQVEQMKKAVAAGATQAELAERLTLLRGMTEVMELQSVIQLETSSGQLLRDPKMIEEAMKRFVDLENELNAIQKKSTQDSTINQLDEIRMAASSFSTNMKKLVVNFASLTDFTRKRRAAGEALSDAARAMAAAGIAETTSVAVGMAQSLSSSARKLLTGALLAILLGIGMMLLITRSITRPIHRIIEVLMAGAEQVSSASGQVSNSSQSLAEGASAQAASIEETSSSLEEMSSMTKQSAENAGQADGLMKEANRVVVKANESMGKLKGSMEEISKASEETSKIIKTIDEIAFQTNLLALNAAVEAARAGDAGAGFAVVAGEVRNLAMRAAEAAKNTAALIEGTVKKVKEGSELVKGTNEAFTEVAGAAAKVGELVAEIAAASQEQAQGIEQVNRAVADMDRVVQQVASNAEESASASEEMNAQAGQMKGTSGELAAMVGGGSKKVGSKEYAVGRKEVKGSGTAEPRAGIAVLAPALGEKTRGMAPRIGGQVKPEQVIPLKGDDFRDF